MFIKINVESKLAASCSGGRKEQLLCLLQYGPMSLWPLFGSTKLLSALACE